MDGASSYTTGAGGYTKKVKIVSVHVCYFSFFSFFQFLQFRSVRLRQVTSGYIRLRQFTLEGRDVELDNFHFKKIATVSHFRLVSVAIEIFALIFKD